MRNGIEQFYLVEVACCRRVNKHITESAKPVDGVCKFIMLSVTVSVISHLADSCLCLISVKM